MPVDTDAEMHIPDEYVSSIQERLNLPAKLDGGERGGTADLQ